MKNKGNSIGKMKTFQLNYIPSSALKKIFIAFKVTSISLGVLLNIIVVRESKRGGRKTSQSNFKIANMC